jgi:hypothetical protein
MSSPVKKPFSPVAVGSRFSLIVETKDGDGVGYIKGAKTQ